MHDVPKRDDQDFQDAAGRGVIAVVVPCYKVADKVVQVLSRVPEQVSIIVCVDDACPERSGDVIERDVSDPRVRVVRHAENKGVGGAVLTGYAAAISLGADVIVKIDGDGQMDPRLVPRFVDPILRGEADYTKGNRFFAYGTTAKMPPIRKFGNSALSFLTKASSGYWQLFDPTNGFTAIHARIAELLPVERIANRFFFESDMLFHLGMMRAVVEDIPMVARYDDEESNLRVVGVIAPFIGGHIRNSIRRFLATYFVRDFSIVTVEFIAGIALLGFGLTYGLLHWLENYDSQNAAPAGVVMLAVTPTILGIQFLLAAINFDITNYPRRPLHPRLGFAPEPRSFAASRKT